MDQERYEEAVPVVIDFIRVEAAMKNDEFKILNWETVLYALYKVTEQHQHEEPTLLRLLSLTERLIGADSDDFHRACWWQLRPDAAAVQPALPPRRRQRSHRQLYRYCV